jgi:hypothetical protein
MRLCRYLILLLSVSLMGCRAQERKSPADQAPLRFDGVYRAEGDEYCGYLRFYPDSMVVVAFACEPPEQVVRWFDRSHLRLYLYTLDGRRVMFSTTSLPSHAIDYEGEADDGKLPMSRHKRPSFANAFQDSNDTATYVFVPLDFEPGPPPPLQAQDPRPKDGATGVQAPLLQWRPGQTTEVHDVYFGVKPELGPEDQVARRQPFSLYYHMPGLVSGTTYYWRVDGIEAHGTIHTGDVWSFTAE